MSSDDSSSSEDQAVASRNRIADLTDRLRTAVQTIAHERHVINNLNGQVRTLEERLAASDQEVTSAQNAAYVAHWPLSPKRRRSWTASPRI